MYSGYAEWSFRSADEVGRARKSKIHMLVVVINGKHVDLFFGLKKEIPLVTSLPTCNVAEQFPEA